MQKAEKEALAKKKLAEVEGGGEEEQDKEEGAEGGEGHGDAGEASMEDAAPNYPDNVPHFSSKRKQPGSTRSMDLLKVLQSQKDLRKEKRRR